ncbi:hypothetical protein CONCODRAFT_170151, partial [Conidiobolus coronatus NRRL 28638]
MFKPIQVENKDYTPFQLRGGRPPLTLYQHFPKVSSNILRDLYAASEHQMNCPKHSSKTNTDGKLTLTIIKASLGLKCSIPDCHANITNLTALNLYKDAGFPTEFEPFNFIENPKLIHPNPIFNGYEHLVKPLLREFLIDGPFVDNTGYIDPINIPLTIQSTILNETPSTSYSNKRVPASPSSQSTN